MQQDTNNKYIEQFRERFGRSLGKYATVIMEKDSDTLLVSEKELLDFILYVEQSAREDERNKWVEVIKGVNGDPFSDSEDVLDGFALCKARVLSLLSPTLQDNK
jgi:hypothetical protein